jgi:hypothetical protein
MHDRGRRAADRGPPVDGGLDHAALDPLDTAVFGTRILLTEQQAWSTEESLRVDRGQSQAEGLYDRTSRSLP